MQEEAITLSNMVFLTVGLFITGCSSLPFTPIGQCRYLYEGHPDDSGVDGGSGLQTWMLRLSVIVGTIRSIKKSRL